MIVEFVDEEPNGLAEMIGGLLGANVSRHPERRSLPKWSIVGVSATDADVSVTLTFSDGGVRIANGSTGGRADLRIRADSADLLGMSSAPLRFGLPDVFTSEGRHMVRMLLSGQVRVEGLLRHPGKLARLTALLSVA